MSNINSIVYVLIYGKIRKDGVDGGLICRLWFSRLLFKCVCTGNWLMWLDLG